MGSCLRWLVSYDAVIAEQNHNHIKYFTSRWSPRTERHYLGKYLDIKKPTSIAVLYAAVKSSFPKGRAEASIA